ncbi:MAG: ComF family protein [Desulfobacterales bacterium]|nr:MAG: ComF family protein [Desulfobacterales bacterium]
MFKSRQGEDHLCGECMASAKKFRIARSVGTYQKPLMDAIHCFKYKGKTQLAQPLGAMLFKSFISCWDVRSVDVIVPVPLHDRKLKMRGFNPSLLLVRHWKLFASELKINMPTIPVVRDVLQKARWTEPQTGLVRKKRIENVKNTFSINDSSKIAGKRILLVDDVYTTGATVNECAKVLLRGKALLVDVLRLARAM